MHSKLFQEHPQFCKFEYANWSSKLFGPMSFQYKIHTSNSQNLVRYGVIRIPQFESA